MGSGVDYTGKKVIVGLTGRIASGVAAFLLKKQGLNVIGVSIVNQPPDAFKNDKIAPRCHVNDLDRVKAFCEELGIPFYATDAISEFDTKVLDPFVCNKLTGRANSTCFNCTNLRIKILVEKMKRLNADYVATGHFCKVHKKPNTDIYSIHANNDVDSDQSTFFAGVDKEYLKYLILPLGDLRTKEAEIIAKKFKLDLKPSKDKDFFCYRAKESYQDMVLSKVPKALKKDGQVQNLDTELYHGEHKGILFHHMTQTNLDFAGVNPKDENIQVVGYQFDTGLLQIGDKSHLKFKGCQLVDLSFAMGLDKTRPIDCFLKNKYSHEYLKASLFFKNNDTAYVEFNEEVYPIIEGEKVVIFDRNTRNAKVIGSGTILARGALSLVDRVDDFKNKNEANLDKNSVELFKF